MTGENGQVSVVMPTYNRAPLIGRAIRSILDQTLANFEFVIVDDGSQDDTAEIVASFDDSRIRYIRLAQNAGEPVARNIGIRAARGAYMAVMDSDDAAEPERLRLQRDFMERNPDVHIVGSHVIKLVGEREKRMRYPASDGVIKARLLQVSGSSMIHPSSFVRMDFVRAHGLSYPNTPTDSDYGFWLEATLAGARFSICPDFLIRYYRHAGNATSERSDGHAAHLRRKTGIRERVLSHFFPDLTVAEVRALAALMETGRTHSGASVRAGLGAMWRAFADRRSHHGEDKDEVFRILRIYETAALRQLAQVRTA